MASIVRVLARTVVCAGLVVVTSGPSIGEVGERPHYRIETFSHGLPELQRRFEPEQLALLEKLNRADSRHLARLDAVVLPDRWDLDELLHSPIPLSYGWATAHSKAVVVHQPAQVFGAYEHGRLVRWGPVSTGRRTLPTPSGLFHLNWRSPGRHSTVDPDWFMRWYFNFHNRAGLSLHEYDLPGRPDSHKCVRLLPRDARWLFDWGEEWQLSADQREVLEPGTPLLIVGDYDFDSPPPWRSPKFASRAIELPADPGTGSPGIR
jgi:hypothetical protein